MEVQTQEARKATKSPSLSLATVENLQASTTTMAFDGLLRFAAGAMLGLALVVGTAGPARADVEAAGFALLLAPACSLQLQLDSSGLLLMPGRRDPC